METRAMGGIFCRRGLGESEEAWSLVGPMGRHVRGGHAGVCEGYLKARVVGVRWLLADVSPPLHPCFVKLFVVDVGGKRRVEGGKVRTQARLWGEDGVLTFDDAGDSECEGSTGPLWVGEGVGVVLGSTAASASKDPVAHSVVVARGHLGVEGGGVTSLSPMSDGGMGSGSAPLVIRMEDADGRHVADCEVDAGFVPVDGVLELDLLEGRRLGGVEPPDGPPRNLQVEAHVCGSTKKTHEAPIGHNPAEFPGGKMQFEVPRLEDVLGRGSSGVAMRVVDRGECLGTAVLPLKESLRESSRWMMSHRRTDSVSEDGACALRYGGVTWLPLRDATGHADPEDRGEVRVGWALMLSHGGKGQLDEVLSPTGDSVAGGTGTVEEEVPEKGGQNVG